MPKGFRKNGTKLGFQKGHTFNKGSVGYWKRKHLPEEAKRKMSLAKKGIEPWNKGLKNCYSEQTIKAMRLAKKGKKLSKEHKENMSKSRKGMKQNLEWRINRRLSQLGEKGSNWQGGKVNKNRQIRYDFRWKEWRRKVFKRDNYTCQDCGQKGGYLEPHHKKKVSEYPELAYDVDNGITYCLKCHIKNDPDRKQFTKNRKK